MISILRNAISVSIFLSSTCCFSQDFDGYARDQEALPKVMATSPKVVLRTNPMTILFASEIPIITSEYKLESEFIAGLSSGIVIGVSGFGKGPVLNAFLDSTGGYSSSDFRLTGVRFQLGYRWYFTKRKNIHTSDFRPAPHGVYLYPRFSYSNAKLAYIPAPNEYLQLVFVNATLNVGYQMLLGSRFILDFYSGIGYKNNSLYEVQGNNTGQITDPELEDNFLFGSPVKINLGSSLGFAF